MKKKSSSQSLKSVNDTQKKESSDKEVCHLDEKIKVNQERSLSESEAGLDYGYWRPSQNADVEFKWFTIRKKKKIVGFEVEAYFLDVQPGFRISQSGNPINYVVTTLSESERSANVEIKVDTVGKIIRADISRVIDYSTGENMLILNTFLYQANEKSEPLLINNKLLQSKQGDIELTGSWSPNGITDFIINWKSNEQSDNWSLSLQGLKLSQSEVEKTLVTNEDWVLFLKSDIDSDNTPLPFSIDNDLGSKPVISGMIDFKVCKNPSELEKTVSLEIRQLKFPGGHVLEKTLFSETESK